MFVCFFFNDTATTEIYTLSLHDALPICLERFPIDKQKKKDHAIAEIYIKANKLYEESDEVKDKVSKLMIDYEAGKDEVVRKFEYAARFCLEGINETLSKLYIKHDTITWESQFVRSEIGRAHV